MASKMDTPQTTAGKPRLRHAHSDQIGQSSLKVHRLCVDQPRAISPLRMKSVLRPYKRFIAILGFTHFWRRSRKGRWIVGRKTSKDRFGRSLKSVDALCRRHRHWSVADQQAMINKVLRGHYAYFGITGNSPALHRFRHEAERRWRYCLDHRSDRARMKWIGSTVFLSAILSPRRVCYAHGLRPP